MAACVVEMAPVLCEEGMSVDDNCRPDIPVVITRARASENLLQKYEYSFRCRASCACCFA
jgi:hypothetical protein